MIQAIVFPENHVTHKEAKISPEQLPVLAPKAVLND